MSGIFKLNTQDFIKGLVVSVITAVLTLVLSILQNGGAIDWKQVGVVALIAGLGYLLKNLASDEQGKVLGKI